MDYLLEMENITKSYGALKANDNITLRIKPNSIHALLGENGAGKSTLVNIIYGLVIKNEGEILWQGKSVEIDSPVTSRNIGIGIVFQHFALFEALSVAENIALGIGYQGTLKTLKTHIVEVSHHYKLDIDPNETVANLSAGEKQRLEIVRCLLQKPKLLILDEPTSVLTPVETNNLFHTLEQLKKDGCSILFIGHKLDEIKRICDDGTVLRRGKLVGKCDVQNMNVAQIAKMMVGSEVASYAERDEFIQAKAVLHLNHSSQSANSKTGFSSKDLILKSGRIMGIAGISGNGQDELMSFLAGEILGDKQDLLYNDKPIGNWSVSKRNNAGILFIPTERLGRSAVTEISLMDNTLLGVGNRDKFIQNNLINHHSLSKFSKNIIKHYDVKADSHLALASSLSGGNLQKFIVGRSILQNPKVLLIQNPTWGVDVSAAIFIRNRLLALRDAGVAVLVASEDLDEMFSICDEIAVIKKNKLSPMQDVATLNIEGVGLMMTE